MSCLNPLYAVRYKYHDDEGLVKYKIKILNSSKYSETRAKLTFGDDLLQLPCGHCAACKMAYRKDWSVRCEMESMFHQKSCFVTLTFDDEHLKPLPVKEDVQYFLHKLRDTYKIKCRYFACGELGSHTQRSHYHLILFGYEPDDLKYYGVSKSGMDMFTSKFLDKVWAKGRVTVNHFDIKCAAYVAGYVKKDKGQQFIMMSNRPGIGQIYMLVNFNKLFKYGHYQGKNGQVHRLPRYFKKLCEKLGYDPIHVQLDNEAMMMEINTSQKFTHAVMYDGELNSIKNFVMKDKLNKLRRSL